MARKRERLRKEIKELLNSKRKGKSRGIASSRTRRLEMSSGTRRSVQPLNVQLSSNQEKDESN